MARTKGKIACTNSELTPWATSYCCCRQSVLRQDCSLSRQVVRDNLWGSWTSW